MSGTKLGLTAVCVSAMLLFGNPDAADPTSITGEGDAIVAHGTFKDGSTRRRADCEIKQLLVMELLPLPVKPNRAGYQETRELA